MRKGEVFAYGGRIQNLKDLQGGFLRKGEVFAYVGLSQNLKNLKDLQDQKGPIRARHFTLFNLSLHDS